MAASLVHTQCCQQLLAAAARPAASTSSHHLAPRGFVMDYKPPKGFVNLA
jgi:hypothetical protein